MDTLAAAGWYVSFVAADPWPEERYTRALTVRNIVLHAWDELGDMVAGGRFDLAVIAFWHVAEQLLPTIRRLSPGTRVVVDSIDLHFVRDAPIDLLRSDRLTGRPAGHRGFTRELSTSARSDGVFTVSEKEAAILRAVLPHGPEVYVVPVVNLAPRGRRGRRQVSVRFRSGGNPGRAGSMKSSCRLSAQRVSDTGCRAPCVTWISSPRRRLSATLSTCMARRSQLQHLVDEARLGSARSAQLKNFASVP